MTDQPPRRSRPPGTVGIALTAAFVAVILFVFWPTDEGASREAAQALRRAAEAAHSQDEAGLPERGQYLYSRIQVSETSVYVAGPSSRTFSFISTSEIESWIGADGSGRKLSEAKGVGFPTPEDESAWEAAGSPDLSSETMVNEFDPGELGFDPSRAPLEPGLLLDAIERREIIDGKGTDLVTFQIVGELLHLSNSSPEHRAALLEAAAQFAGVGFEGSVTDPTGRPGVSVSFVGDGRRHELIINTETGGLLAERSTVLDPAEAGAEVPPDAEQGTVIRSVGPPDTVVLWRLYLENAIVNTVDSRPE